MNKHFRIFINFIKRDWLTKLAMVVLSLILWLSVGIMQSKSGTFPGAIEIEARNTPTGTVAILSEQYAEVEINANSTTWQDLQPDDMDLYVDLSDYNIGTYELEIQANSHIGQATITSINPKKIFVTIEPIITKELPVNLEIEGLPGNDYVVDSYIIEPDTITVIAPENYISDIKQVTAQLKLNGETSSFTRDITVTIPSMRSDLLQSITISPSKVEVAVTISTEGESKTVGINPVVSGQPENGYYVSAITTTPATLNITGPASILSTINSVSTETVDISNLTDNQTYSVPIVLPDNVSSSIRRVEITVNVTQAIN